MTRTQRRTRIKSGIILATALVLLIALFAISFAFTGGGGAIAEEIDYESLNYDDTTIRTGDVEDFLAKTETERNKCRPTDGIVDTKNEFCFVFLALVDGNYTLGKDFKITATNWSASSPTLYGNLNGNNHVIWNASTVANASASTSVVGGLASSNFGTVSALNYYYTGSMYAKKHSSSDSVAMGGLFGKNFGTITGCSIVISGSLISEGDTKDVTSNVGGVIGYNEGIIYNCGINCSLSIESYSDKETGSSSCNNNIIHSGGVIGKMYEGRIDSCTIKSSANVIAADNVDKWANDTASGITGWIGDNLSDIPVIGGALDDIAKAFANVEYNDKQYVHPAGVVIGCLDGNGGIKNCDISVTGSALSYGMAGSSNVGSIAGGFIGLIDETSVGTYVQSNKITLSCAISAFVLPSLNLTDQLVDYVGQWIKSRNVDVFIGAFAGRSKANSGNIKNNFIFIDKDNGIIEDGATFDEGDDVIYSCSTGLMCGNAEISTLLGVNNWLTRNLSECDTGRVAGNAVDCGKLNHLCIYGDGEIKVNGTIVNDEEFTVTAKPVCSPFYGFTENLYSDSPSFSAKGQKTKSLSGAGQKVCFAVFIDTEIESSGELTQFAYDVNLTQNKVWKFLGTSNTENRMYFNGAGRVSLTWLKAYLKKDILVQSGTPVIEEFYGKFYGEGHTISFASGSHLSHDVEQEKDDTEDKSDIPDYNERNTGLFGVIKGSALVTDLTLLFGGNITDTSGLEYSSYRTDDDDTDDLLAATKRNQYDTQGATHTTAGGVKSRTVAVTSSLKLSDILALADLTKFDQCYSFFLSGTGYDALRELNPGYIEVVPYLAEVIVDIHNVGILAGKNEGTIRNVTVDATKSAYVNIVANTIRFGTLCGMNTGTVTNASASLRGKVQVKARNTASTGGLFGYLSPSSSTEISGVSGFVGGEIKVLEAQNYHLVSINMYEKTLVKETETPGAFIELDDGYTQVAYEYTMTSGGTDSAPREVVQYIVGVQTSMATKNIKVSGNEDLDVNKAIGSLIGMYCGSNVEITDAAGVSGDKGSFNTVIYQSDDTDGHIGGMIGYLDASLGVPTFNNGWAVMSYKEFDKGADGRKAIGDSTSAINDSINLVYVQTAIVIPNIKTSSATPISFELEAKEGMTYSGWYDYTSGTRTVVTDGLGASVFTPQTQPAANMVFVVELIELQIFTEAQIDKLAVSANEGRGYLGVEFTLGTDLTVANLLPIGTEEYPFRGTFDGNGLKITISGARTSDLLGLFGCVGEEGIVKNLTVYVPGNLGNQKNTIYAGAIAAVNYGTIGQDISTGKVIAQIKGSLTGANVGGLVGKNAGTLKNAEAHFVSESETAHGQLFANSEVKSRVYGGGAVGINQCEEGSAVVKNIIVRYDASPNLLSIGSTMSEQVLGGVIGYNDEGAAAYSLVAVVSDAKIINRENGGAGSASRAHALSIGYNESRLVDSLWTLYLSRVEDAEDPNQPLLGAPISVYNEEDGGSSTGKAVLMNGEYSGTANILFKYGWGNVSVSIDGAVAQKGGKITFMAEKLTSGDHIVDFYDYVADFQSGEKVSVSEGNTGYAFNPRVGTNGTNGLTGKTYYAGFANTLIANQSDYIALQTAIAADYRLYVEYNLTASFTLDSEVASSPIGSEQYPFRGSISGNAYTVTMSSTHPTHAFVSVLGDSKDEHCYSEIRNLRLAVQAGTSSVQSGTNVARGFLTDINYGTISGVTVTVRGSLVNQGGAAGAVTGINYGKIDSATVVFEYGNYLGNDGYGAIIAKYVGGVAGINFGTIGGSTANAIDVTIRKSNLYSGVLYGSECAGGVVGLNDYVMLDEYDESISDGKVRGVLRSAIVSASGILAGKNAGGYVGYNKGIVESGLISITKDAVYFGTDTFGVIAGTNEGTIGVLQNNAQGERVHSDTVRGYVYAQPTTASSVTLLGEINATIVKTDKIGGVAGVNTAEGAIYATLAELHASIIAAQYAGGFAGVNQGVIAECNLLSTERSAIYAQTVGGFAGTNGGDVEFALATLRGNVGSNVAGANGIVAAEKAGGMFGVHTGSVKNSSVALYKDVYGSEAALAASLIEKAEGDQNEDHPMAENAWVQICNSSLNKVSVSENCGFNLIRVLNETLLSVEVDYSKARLTFTSIITDVKKWYTDISGWTKTSGFLEEGSADLPTLTVFMPDPKNNGLVYYVCYDDLTINDLEGLNNLASMINSHSYYNHVLFRLASNLNVGTGTVIRPIGTEEHPFNGIFDGGYHKITLSEKSGISGTEYAGLFGYTAPDSRISDFLFVVSQRVTIGSVNSYEVGALIGYSQGYVQNVFVNLSTSITSNSAARYRGAFIGRHVLNGAEDNIIENCWISILNDAAPAVGNMVGDDAYGLNYIGVLGSGRTDVKFYANYQNDSSAKVRVVYYVPQTNEEYFKSFGGWFDDIRLGNAVSQNTVTNLGEFTFDKEGMDISLTPYATDEVYNKRITLSFISLVITNEEDFIRFANNINTYGDQGAKFSLEPEGDADYITVDFSKCPSVGTAERPFTGEFNGNYNRIYVVGSMIKREYAGVFGYVGEGGLIKNLFVDVTGENVKVGDNSTLYSGIAAALLYGELRNVVVTARADTVVYTTQGLPSSGGLVGRAGKKAEKVSESDISYKIDNSWLVLAEGSSISNVVGQHAYYLEHSDTCGVGRKMQIVGRNGTLYIGKYSNGEGITFDASENTSAFSGFIDNENSQASDMVIIHDGGTGASPYYWTVLPGDHDLNGASVGEDMVCVCINKYIETEQDLIAMMEDVRDGRNYKGIVYELTKDITITGGENGVYQPIGGAYYPESGSGSYSNYVERDFIGGFIGNGHTITIPENVKITARYAGLFGRLGESARISDLTVEANCKIGYDSGNSTTRTIYAGVLAAYATGGQYENVVVVMNKRASLYAAVSTGRAFGYLAKEAGNAAVNCWVISYNSKDNYELNANEMAFDAAYRSAFAVWAIAHKSEIEEYEAEIGESTDEQLIYEKLASKYASAFTLDDPDSLAGANQGGFNTLMVVAAGTVDATRNEQDVTKYIFSYTGTAYWYPLNGFSGDLSSVIGAGNGQYDPQKTATRTGYNVSFLNSEISSLDDLKLYAESVNNGYNFYKLTFTLTSDITINKEDGFFSIGTEASGVNGTFDGQGHTVTISQGTVIDGRYAGLFGYVAAEGTVKNLRIVVSGTLGKNDYTETQIKEGKQNTLYAGAVAYNAGTLKNLIVIANGTRFSTLNGISGLAVGYDATNLVSNVWALVDASDYMNSIGRVAIGDSGVNTMKIIGIGTVDATFEEEYKVKFTSETIDDTEWDKEWDKGWYKSYEKNQQISSAMLSGGSLHNGKKSYLIAPLDLFGVEYEVAAIKTTVETLAELRAIAEDVNVGGYSFENITFTLGADIDIRTTGMNDLPYLSIGTEKNPFKGTFCGKLNDDYYKLTLLAGSSMNALFTNNAGVIRDLTVIVKGTVGRAVSGTFGAVAEVNNGTIERTFVEIADTGSVVGYSAGGIVGRNNGTVSDCVVIVRGSIVSSAQIGDTLNAGGMVGINFGTVNGTTDYSAWIARNLLPTDTHRVKSDDATNENGYEDEEYAIEANLFLFGNIIARTGSKVAYANAGGVVGNQYGGSLNYLISYVAKGGVVASYGPADSTSIGRAGGLVGYARAAVNHSTVFLYGEVVFGSEATSGTAASLTSGGTAGYLDGVFAMNVWQVTLNRILPAASQGSKSVNSLNIKGNGKIKASIDADTESILFANIPDYNGSQIDGWCTAPTVEVDSKTGNIGENGNTFLPLAGIQNKYVMVIFVNTEIHSVADLADMASSVSAGLSGDSIVFNLLEDLELNAENALTQTIGSEEYPFNNVFNGNGHTITVKAGALPGDEYVGLFGYTGLGSTIRNLNVVVESGTYGSVNTDRTAVLASYAEGRIENVEITVKEGATILGKTAAVVAATFFGEMENVNLTLAGIVRAANKGNVAIAGGFTGANDGTVKSVEATLADSAEITVSEAATAYVGVIAGENYKAISCVTVYYEGKLAAAATMTGYAGVVTALNLGYVENAYVEITDGVFGECISGGLVGNNVNVITTSLVKIAGTFTGTDGAIGYTKANDPEKVYNVWVYSDKVANLSSANCVNGITFEEGLILSCPDAAAVRAGKIEFANDVSALKTGMRLFANVKNGEFEAGSGAAMDHIVYTDTAFAFVSYTMDSETVIPAKVANYKMCLVTRNEIASGSELYAFALAMQSGIAFDACTFTLEADFTLPERVFPTIDLGANVVLNGKHHVVTVGNATLGAGLFGRNEGEIDNIGMRLTKTGAASLVAENNGSLRNAVVYLEKEVSLTGGKYFVADGSGSIANLWLVVRDAVAPQENAAYKTIRINGIGALVQGGANGGMTFTAENTEEGMIFIGYTDGEALTYTDALFNTADKAKALYTAEFISTVLDSDYKLQVLSDVASLGFTGANVTFTLGADLTANNALFTAPFVGKVVGNGHAVRATAAVVGSLFGKFAGEMTNVVLDLTALASSDVTLFANDNGITLMNVVIKEGRSALAMGAAVQATNVWIESENEALYDKFLLPGEDAALYASFSLLYRNGGASYTFSSAITVTAADTDEQVFAGYFEQKNAVLGVIGKNKSLALPVSAGKIYMLNYINRVLSSSDDLFRLSTAVSGGFDFDGVTFTVADGGFTVDREIKTIGSESAPFKGSICGNDKASTESDTLSVITFANYTSEDHFTVYPFLDRLYGELCNLFFRYDEEAVFAGTPTLVNRNTGAMRSVVVASEAADLFEGGAGLTLMNEGDMENCWFVTGGTEKGVAEGSLVGVNEMRLDSSIFDLMDLSFNGSRLSFALSPMVGYYVCLYNYQGEVVFPGNYNYASGMYVSPATASGVKLAVKSSNVITNQDELIYLGYLTSGENFQAGSVITLGADLVIDRAMNTVIADGMIFDLNGHSIRLNAPTGSNAVLFGKNSTAGSIKNGSVYLRKGYYGLAAAGTNLQNVALFLEDAAITLPEYVLVDNSVTVVTAYRAYADFTDDSYLVSEEGMYYFMYAPKQAAFSAVFDEQKAMSFEGKENDLYYYSKIVEVSPQEQEALFAPKVIATAQDYEAFVKATNNQDDHFAFVTDSTGEHLPVVITLAADVTLDGIQHTAVHFEGTLLAGGHTVTIQNAAFSDTYLDLGENGSASDLALALVNCVISNDADLIALSASSRIALVVYRDALDLPVVETDACVANVYGEEGRIQVIFGDKILFRAQETQSFALRYWKDADGVEINKENGKVKDRYDGEQAVSVYFERCYRVKVVYSITDTDGADRTEEIQKNHADNLPTFTGTGVYFVSDAPAISVVVANIGESFFLREVGGDDHATVTVSDADAWVFNVAYTSAQYEITLTAKLTYLEMSWKKTTYNASKQSIGDLDEFKTDLIAAGYTADKYDIEFYPTPLGDTPALVEGMPYHAGSYLITFTVTTKGKGDRVLCYAYCGLEIQKALLTFESIEIEDKVYDGTDVANLKAGSLRISGFCGEEYGAEDARNESRYVSLQGLTFRFANADAEQGKAVYVAGKGMLAYDPTFDADGSKRYVYLNYRFDDASVSSVENGKITANIKLATLRLEVASKEVEYLQQFNEQDEIDTDVTGILPSSVSGLVTADEQAYAALAPTLLSREKADVYDAGYYRIIVKNNLELKNYNVILTGEEAYYIVKPSLVKVVFATDDTMVYGDNDHSPQYGVFKGTDESGTYKGMHAGDELYFTQVVYNGGEEMIPSENRYSFTCLFSAENKNYTVKADSYKIVNGVSLPVLQGNETLTVTKKPVQAEGDDRRNNKSVGKKKESIYASLSAGYSFAKADHKLVATRAQGERVGDYLLTFAVVDASGADVTARYTIQTARDYYYHIDPVTLIIKPTRTSVIYGNSISAINYTFAVEGGGISNSELYYAIYGTEKSSVTLADLGITAVVGYSQDTVLDVGEYGANLEWGFTDPDSALNANIQNVLMSGGQNKIIVQQRYVTITISQKKVNNRDYKTYDGKKITNLSTYMTYEVNSGDIIRKDRDNLSVVLDEYILMGDGVSVGIYPVDGKFHLHAKDGSNAADNYFIKVVQGTLTIETYAVRVNARVGYFDEEGNFTPATITRTDGEEEDTIYYGDSRAVLCFTLGTPAAASMLNVPTNGTDKEISDRIESALKISYYRLNTLTSFTNNGSNAATNTGLSSANTNYKVTFDNISISVARVHLTLKINSPKKVIGEPDPEITYTIIARDPDDNNKEIKDYNEISKGTFTVVITAERTGGESLGSYTYTDVAIDLVNAVNGQSLFDENSETGKDFAENIELKKPAKLALEIEEESFLKSTLGKWLVYGGSVAVFAALVIVMMVVVPKKRAKKLAKKAAEQDAKKAKEEQENKEQGEEVKEDAGEEPASEQHAAEQESEPKKEE